MANVRQRGLSAAIALALAPGIAAQTSSTPSTSTPPDQMTAVTVTGCVRRNTTSAAPSTREAVGTTGAQARSSFVLTNARSNPAGATTPDAVVITSTVTMYQLSGDDKEVAENVGRSVQITGTVDKRDGAIDRAATRTTAAAALPKLTVITVTQTSDHCSK